MIDTLMALWNRGYGGRGILVTIAFSLICISISLLLVSAGSSWFSSGGRGLPAKHISIISAGDLTATAQSNNIRPVADNTVTIYAPTPRVTPSVTATTSTSPTVIVTGTIPPHLRGGGTPITTGTVASGRNRTSGSTDCSHNKLVDSVGLNADGSVVATIERHLWIILGGSTLGTLCFYMVVYVVARKRAR